MRAEFRKMRRHRKDKTPCLVLRIDGETTFVMAEDVHDDERFRELQEACSTVQGSVEVCVVHLPDQPPDDRVASLDLLTSLKRPCEFYGPKNGKGHKHLLPAILELMVAPTDNLDRYIRVKTMALELAAVEYPEALEAPCQQILQRMRELGVSGVRVNDLIRDAREILRGVGQAADGPGERQAVTIRSVIEDAPLSGEAIVPPGWTLSAQGIALASEHGVISIPAPVLITERHVDINGAGARATVAWKRDGAWHKKTVDRAAIANSRRIVDELAAFGVTVTTNNAKELVQYLADFETANLEHIPVTQVTKQLGWQGDGGREGFLWGKTLIDGDLADGTIRKGVRFCGADEGDDQIAAGFHKRGTFDKWRNAIAKISPFPRVKLALYASFVPPLLSILRTRNFVVDFAGKTTAGKTTCLRVAASPWGDPDDNNPAGLIKTWDGTATFRERVPAVVNHLPYLLDDSKHARTADEVAKTVYSVVQGRGRGRGSTKGLARQDTWHTVLFTSGEQPVTSFTEDGGSRARVLSLWGSPFNKVDAETGKLVRRLNERLKRNFGHAGPRLVKYIIEHRDQWTDWRKEYLEKVDEYEAQAGDNEFAGRMATDFAAIAVAGRIAHEALDLPWHFEDPIQPLFTQLAKEASEADRSAAALRYVMDWAYSHQGEFFGRSRDSRKNGTENKEAGQPNGGWAGRWDANYLVPGEKCDPDTWEWIGFLPAKLRDILRDGGFEPDSIIRTWRDEGWLASTKEKGGKRRYEVKARIGDATPWLIAIRQGAVVKCGG